MTYDPATSAIGVAITTSIILTFTKGVAAGSGNIVVKPQSGSATNIPVSDSQVSISGSTLTIEPSASLEENMQYTVTMAAGVVTC